MSIFSRWILVLAIFVAIPSLALAQSAASPVTPPEWPVTSAPARFVVNPNHGGSPGQIVCLPLFLPDPKWAAMPIRVFNAEGVAVGSDLISSSPGEPITLVFDSSSGSKLYKVYVGSNWPPMHLANTKAGVWLETREGHGKIFDHLPDLLQAWNQGAKTVGRAVLNGIFEGGNRFGPETNLLLHFQGWFDLPTQEHLQFALVSVDSSFVLIDGKEVVEWPGRHERWWGPAGPPQGAVDLAAGPHLVDYYNAYVASENGEPPITCTLSVKGGLFTNWTVLNGTPFFRPVSYGEAETYEMQKGSPAGAAPALAIDWKNQEQSVIYADLSDIGFISMQLRCLVASPGTLTWTFDDGSTAQGQTVTHLFPRPGMRQVHLSLKDGDKEVATLDQTIGVHADWPGNKEPGLHAEHEADISGRDPATLSASDLASCFALFEHYRKGDELFKLLPAVRAKMKDVSEADLPYLKKGVLFLTREDWVHATEQMQFLRALIERCGQGTPSPQSIAVASECRLALARLVYKTSEPIDEVKALLAAIDPASLTGDEPRVLKIQQADLALAVGDVPGARKQYMALTGDPSGPDVRSSIRRTARIGQARAYIDRKDFDAAEDALNEVAWTAPIEKLSPDWALTRLRLYQEENLPGIATIWAKRLLPVLTESGRSELLFRLTGLAFAQGDNDLAQKTLSELLKKHPYSEEAAQAKAKWPGKE